MERVVFIADLETYFSDHYDLDDDDDFVVDDSYLPLRIIQHIDDSVINGTVVKKQEDMWLIEFKDEDEDYVDFWFPKECFVLEVPIELTGTEL